MFYNNCRILRRTVNDLLPYFPHFSSDLKKSRRGDFHNTLMSDCGVRESRRRENCAMLSGVI
jgi:hypothetical protein